MAVLALSVLAVGCSSPEDKMRGEFLSGCAQSGADRDFCNCVFDSVVVQFDLDYLERMNRSGRPTPEFFEAVAVGTAVTCRPPHRSVRAELPHTAPASGM